MRLELKRAPQKFLEITKPDGVEIRLQLRNITVSVADELERIELDDQRKVKSGEITNTEYILSAFERVCEGFDRNEIKDLDIDHVSLILEKIRELQKQKEPEEKKSQ